MCGIAYQYRLACESVYFEGQHALIQVLSLIPALSCLVSPVFIHSLPIKPASVRPKGHSTPLNPNTQSVFVLAWP